MSTAPDSHAALAPGPSDCIVCGGRRMVRHFRARRGNDAPAARTQPYRITHSPRQLVSALVRCRDCGMVHLPPDIAGTASYEDGADPTYVAQETERVANAHRLLDLLPSGGRLLEVGCACGFLLLAARARGFEVCGVEASVWAADHARAAYGLTVHRGTLESAQLAGAAIDAVVMADVIEHLPDPRATVREAQRVLRPGGALLVLTPDIGSAMARLTGRHWWGLLDDHLHYFSRATLRRLLESEGFAVERIVAFGRSFPLRHWVDKLAPYGATLHAQIARLVRAARVDGRPISLNFGDQMACVARKR